MHLKTKMTNKKYCRRPKCLIEKTLAIYNYNFDIFMTITKRIGGCFFLFLIKECLQFKFIERLYFTRLIRSDSFVR
jgi:hypothetical protein